MSVSLRSIWNEMPALRLLLSYMTGIALYLTFGNNFLTIAVTAFFLLGSLGVVLYTNKLSLTAQVYRLRYVSGSAMILVMLSLGYLLSYLATDTMAPDHIAHYRSAVQTDSVTYRGMIVEPVVVGDKTVSAIIRLEQAGSKNGSQSVTGKVLAHIQNETNSQRLNYGDEVVFRGEVKPLDAQKNPAQFDYRSYQALHHIYDHAYLRAGQWIVVSHQSGNIVMSGIYRLRAQLLNMILYVVPGANERAVATAILLGYRDYMNDDVLQAYAGSGVLHVLSVSGLHVAILFAVLGMLLSWMESSKRLKLYRAIIIIGVLIFYACITGMSTPVLRAVFMLSLITIAQLIDRDVSIYNTIAASCLLLLLYDPYYLADVGFQLSYIAVVGIVYLYPVIKGALPDIVSPLPYRALRWAAESIISLIAVSIAAQIATVPLSLYYFHTFPNLFLLSNLLVIPLSNLILITGMLLLTMGWSAFLLHGIGTVFNQLLVILDRFVFYIDSLPFALSEGWMLSSVEVLLSFVFIGLCCWYLSTRRARVLIATLGCLLLLCSSFSIREVVTMQQHELVVYSTTGKRAIAYLTQQTAYVDMDTSINEGGKTFRYAMQNHWWSRGVRASMPLDSLYPTVLPFGKLYILTGKRVIIADKVIDGADTPLNGLKVDILILTGNNRNEMAQMSQIIDANQIIFDTSNKKWRVDQWIKDCKEMRITYHDCRERAYVLDL